ncbi:unnamed protein product [Polarella glacialis]|uniref:Uncharacterized protein n=1 Tax=Polarella glacialis TaxID=89957 RepID=A0A813HF16_POLGL|nr:unnamed protein product [Polarella glacialis]
MSLAAMSLAVALVVILGLCASPTAAVAADKGSAGGDFLAPSRSVLLPEPATLRWDEQPAPGGEARGVLTVPLDPSDADSPSLELEVRMKLSRIQPAPLGPLLMP